LCAYFGGLFGNVTFGQLCEWLAGLIMKVNLTPPNIQTKLLSKHPGDICKVPQTGPQFCQNRGWNEMSGWRHNTQEPKKIRGEIKIKQKTRLVFSPKLILAGVSPPSFEICLTWAPWLLAHYSFIKSKPFQNKILQIFWTWDTQFHATVPNFTHFNTTLKIGEWNKGLETRAQRQGDITDKWYVQFQLTLTPNSNYWGGWKKD
jgi:hypothetical protein